MGWAANDGGAISSSDHFLRNFDSTRPEIMRKVVMNKFCRVLWKLISSPRFQCQLFGIWYLQCRTLPKPNTSIAKLTFWYFIPPYIDFSSETVLLLANSSPLPSTSMSIVHVSTSQIGCMQTESLALTRLRQYQSSKNHVRCIQSAIQIFAISYFWDRGNLSLGVRSPGARGASGSPLEIDTTQEAKMSSSPSKQVNPI